MTEGSGKRLATIDRTISAVVVQEQVIQHGDHGLASYVASSNTSVGASSLATINSHLYQLMAGSSANLRIRRVEVHQAGLATTAAFCAVGLYRLTTAGTGGTSETPAPLDQSEAACGATAQRLPSSKGTEGAVIAVAEPYILQTAAASLSFPNPVIVWDFDGLRSKPLIVNAGTSNGIAIKNLTAIAGTAAVYVNIWFDETAW